MSAVIQTSAYCKIFLHAAKYSSSAIGGYIIGTGHSDQINITDIVPICHNNPCGPMFEIAAEMTESLFAGTQSRILGYYYANETATSARAAYIENIVKGISNITGGSCLLLEVQNDLISNDDALVIKATMNNILIKVTPSSDTIKVVNKILDQLLSKNYHRYLIDFEDHMDTAAANSKGECVSDFRNSFIIEAIQDCRN